MSQTPPEPAGPRSAFTVDSAFLSGSSLLIGLPLCEARLQNDARWPWIVLIPRRAGCVEIHDLAPTERGLLMEEVVLAGEAVRAMAVALGRPVDKLNVGALGNVTPQLHAHVVGRRRDDAAWPGPVWGVGVAQPYATDELETLRLTALDVLAGG
ncbi:MAG: HIT domain-containing protein [Caulobacteraceae bacterium]